MLKPLKLYCAIRRDVSDGHEWMDYATLSALLDLAAKNARDTDASIPHWASANPVVRVVPVTLSAEG